MKPSSGLNAPMDIISRSEISLSFRDIFLSPTALFSASSRSLPSRALFTSVPPCGFINPSTYSSLLGLICDRRKSWRKLSVERFPPDPLQRLLVPLLPPVNLWGAGGEELKVFWREFERTFFTKKVLSRIPGQLLLMQPAFGLLEACPSACSRVFAWHYGPGAGFAADRGVVLVMERAVGDVVLVDVVPYVLGGQPDERVDLHQAELLVPTDDRGVGPCRGLVAPDAGYRAPAARRGLGERDHLPYVAALIRLPLPELGAELRRHLL